MEMNSQFLEPRSDAAVFVQPADALLHDRTLPAGFRVEPDLRVVPGMFVIAVRDDLLDALGPVSVPAAARVARTRAPSTHQSSQSIRPFWSSLICNFWMIVAKTPALRHLEKWSYTVCHGPKRSRRSRRGAPLQLPPQFPQQMPELRQDEFRHGQFDGRG